MALSIILEVFLRSLKFSLPFLCYSHIGCRVMSGFNFRGTGTPIGRFSFGSAKRIMTTSPTGLLSPHMVYEGLILGYHPRQL